MTTLYDLFRQLADQLEDTTAVQALNAADLSYRGVLTQIDAVASALAGWGIGRGDRVLIQLPNGAEPFLAFHGTGAAAVALLVDPRASTTELEHFLTFVQPRAIIRQQGVDVSGRALAQQHGVRVFDIIPTPEQGAGTFVFADPAVTSSAPLTLNGPDDLSYLVTTSGTTALPKLVAQTQSTMLRNVLLPLEAQVPVLGERYPIWLINYAPMHLWAGILNVSSALASQGRAACMPGFDIAQIFDWLGAYQSNRISASPSLLEYLVTAAQGRDPQLWQSIRAILTGSAPLTQALSDDLRRTFGLPVVHVYGMTEIAMIAQGRADPGEVIAEGMAGKPIDPDHLRIMADDGSFLPVGEQGEVVLRTDLFIGYWNNPDANAEAFLNGWFRTGDMGYLTEDGSLFLTGRVKEVINSGGAKVSPLEVETVLLQHPQVREAAVFGLKNADVGEVVAAAVVGDVSERALRKFAAERLPFYKVPVRIILVDAIPKAASGKVQRNQLAGLLNLT